MYAIRSYYEIAEDKSMTPVIAISRFIGYLLSLIKSRSGFILCLRRLLMLHSGLTAHQLLSQMALWRIRSGIREAKIGTSRMNGSDSEPYWEKGISSQSPFIERENGCL